MLIWKHFQDISEGGGGGGRETPAIKLEISVEKELAKKENRMHEMKERMKKEKSHYKWKSLLQTEVIYQHLSLRGALFS